MKVGAGLSVFLFNIILIIGQNSKLMICLTICYKQYDLLLLADNCLLIQ